MLSSIFTVGRYFTFLCVICYELIVKKEVIEYERLDRIKLETGRKSALFERNKNEIILQLMIDKICLTFLRDL